MKTLSFAALFCVFGFLSPGFASQTEVERLDKVIEAALDAVYGEDARITMNDEKRARVLSIVEAEYDLSIIIRRAIGRNWNFMNPQEQEQVLELVKQLVVKAYVEGMEGRERPSYELGRPIEISDRRIEIPSRIRADGKTVHVLYRLGKMRNGWQLYDIVAENISIVANYREQIDDHFRKGNGADLIAKLRELLKKENLDEKIQF